MQLTPFDLAQLRHAYKLLSEGKVKDQKFFADGLMAPIIRKLEKQKMEISPEMVQDGIKTIVKKYQDKSVLTQPEQLAALTDVQLSKRLDEEWDALTRELTLHAYSFAELPPPKFKEILKYA